jgi:hypothetical protein
MAKNTHQTSGRVAGLASKTLQSDASSKTAKSLAASALAQTKTNHQTGAAMEALASKVLRSEKYAADTKELAGSVLSQSNKAR